MAPKRKRNTAAAAAKRAEAEVAQPSSRDASEEDIRDPVLQEVSQLKQKQQAESSDQPPAAKRSRSSRTAEAKAEANGDVSSDAAASALEDALENGEGGERGKMGMEAPPKAGLVDPVGYKTNPPPTDRPVRVYADGVFDLLHLGHMRVLQQAKEAFPDTYLIVGVTGDKETHRRKGLTVLSGKERADSVRHCKWVDEVVEDCPWIIADHPEFMEKYKIDYVAHDDLPYAADEGDDVYAPIKAAGKFLVTQRTEGVSTTGIITKIVKDYDKYISRQLKRGTPRQELNVSWLKMNELEIKRSVSELRNNIKSNWSTTGQELGKELRQFWQPSRPASPSRGTSFTGVDASYTPKSSLHLEVPKSPTTPTAQSSDFAAGYSLGLIGGVRSWMARSRSNLNDSSRPESPVSAEESDDKAVASSSSARQQGGVKIKNS